MRCLLLIPAAWLLATCSLSSGGAGDVGSDDPASLLAKDDGSSDVAAYVSALDAWAARCTGGRVHAAGVVDATFRDEQANGGPDPDRLTVMRHLAASVPSSVGRTDCSGVAAAYLVLVER
jgi:hypothetical protein